jgi:hypothetical protein
MTALGLGRVARPLVLRRQLDEACGGDVGTFAANNPLSGSRAEGFFMFAGKRS